MTRPRPTEGEIEAEREIANAKAVYNARHTSDKIFDVTEEVTDEENRVFATWDMQIQVRGNPTYANKDNKMSLIIIAQKDDEIDVRTELLNHTDTSVVHDIQLTIPGDFGDRRHTSTTIPKTVTSASVTSVPSEEGDTPGTIQPEATLQTSPVDMEIPGSTDVPLVESRQSMPEMTLTKGMGKKVCSYQRKKETMVTNSPIEVASSENSEEETIEKGKRGKSTEKNKRASQKKTRDEQPEKRAKDGRKLIDFTKSDRKEGALEAMRLVQQVLPKDQGVSNQRCLWMKTHRYRLNLKKRGRQ